MSGIQKKDLIINKDYRVKNVDFGKTWCWHKKTVVIPKGLKFAYNPYGGGVWVAAREENGDCHIFSVTKLDKKLFSYAK